MSDQSLRDAIAVALHDKECSVRNCEPTTMGTYYDEADKILAANPAEPARPMPTREQIKQTVAEAASVTGLAKYFKGGSPTDPSDLDEFTHAIEVLLNGAES